MNVDLIIEWSVLIAVLVLLVYTMVVIAEENKAYKDSAIDYLLGGFLFKVPSWWQATQIQENKVRFERTDTRYAWHAYLSWRPSYREGTSIQEEMRDIILEKKIEMDRDSTDISEPLSFQKHPNVMAGELEMVRVEGTGTQGGTDRIYYDAYLIRDLKRKGSLYCESHSSVLNGAVEGPYFEEMMGSFRRTL